MKKLVLIGLVSVLAACASSVKPQGNTETLVQVPNVQKNCVYLYKVSADREAYSHEDAVQYLKNQIAAQNKTGNVFWLEKDEKEKVDGAVFGPKYRYLLTARVYDCAIAK